MEEKIWKDVPGYEGLYRASTLGEIMSLNYDGTGASKIMRGHKEKSGYIRYELYKERKSRRFFGHFLVAKTFLEIPHYLIGLIGTRRLQINHKDENKSNNRVSNLEWCSSSYNLSYGTRPRRVLDAHKASGSKRAEKSVRQYDSHGNFIAGYISIHYAAVETGLDFSKIAMCTRGERKQHGGFLWCYADDADRIKEIESLRDDSSPKLF